MTISSLRLVDEAPDNPFLDDVLLGLLKTQKTLPCKYLYDHNGSALFDRICDCEDYYITRTEMAILRQVAPDIAEIAGKNAALIEPGAGAIRKLSILLKAMENLAVYIPIDISSLFLKEAAIRFQGQFPNIQIHPVVADFTQVFKIDRAIEKYAPEKRVVFFPGSTFGNFSREEGHMFLKNMHDIVGERGEMIIGIDLIKDTARLERAYNDCEGITAAFNKNILRRINRELGGRFDLDAFEHKSLFNAQESRIEMHLISQKKQSIPIGEHIISFEKGETIHTENSYKYSDEDFVALVSQSGFSPCHRWSDPENLFGVYYLSH